ncbi:nucleoside hydrolase [Bittarella massiliensis]|uniref:Nucleoside hydrolase n=1 Tax=Bittarella massiliensis (ex Durand et al. 2017) TaxID=1720313 RepID=A0ABW9WTR0_9FIRM|nr:hypothetical protein HMPREF0262_03429 [Clostridium sp. ATCC 29733]MZL69181.1 nucleoside hydrolase [Bittarella massiliensis (ex Durand et al. 2017)]MZL79813.1 nucleoside hydrolase [Bittarella massiliensis (ex Durand et al. 2017)]
MKKIIIDTDTASDDAVALVAALRDPTLQVLAITTVAGNVELPLAVKNALLSVERAGTYRPPVHVGAPAPSSASWRRPTRSMGPTGWGTWGPWGSPPSPRPPATGPTPWPAMPAGGRWNF